MQGVVCIQCNVEIAFMAHFEDGNGKSTRILCLRMWEEWHKPNETYHTQGITQQS